VGGVHALWSAHTTPPGIKTLPSAMSLKAPLRPFPPGVAPDDD